MRSVDHVASNPLDACPPEATVSCDLHCVGCGYNLRTMRFDGRCAECGLTVEGSVLILPQPQETSEAITLSAFAFAVGLGGVVVPPFRIIAVGILLWAAHRLRSRCKLSHMSNLGPKVRWFWNTVLISALAMALLVANQLGNGDYRLLPSAPTSTMKVSQRQTAGQKVVRIYFSDVSGVFDVTTDAQGRRKITLLDASGNPISQCTLTASQSTSVRDAAGKNVQLDLDAAGMLAIHVRASSQIQLLPNASTALVTKPPRLLKISLATAVSAVGLTATILYLLICRALAIRVNRPRLARRFKIILRVIVGSLATIVVIFGSAMLGANIGGVPRMAPLLAAVSCLLVAGVSQIVASIQLSTTLRRMPRHWSDVVTVPGGE